MEAKLAKLVEEPDVYYTVYWSRLQKADRYQIITKVPSVSGIFELYYQDEHKQLNLFHIAKAWYGGLRTGLRKATDPELEDDEIKKEILPDMAAGKRTGAMVLTEPNAGSDQPCSTGPAGNSP